MMEQKLAESIWKVDFDEVKFKTRAASCGSKNTYVSYPLEKFLALMDSPKSHDSFRTM